MAVDPAVTVCVYCASRVGRRGTYRDQAVALGAAIAEMGWGLVYGGGHVGLMGAVADAALEGGSKVTGVITRHLLDLEVGHDAVTELVVVDDMASRKREMFERSDAFVVLPGGIGTLEELSEVWCWSALGLHDKPLVLVDVEGYYEGLVAFLRRGIDDDLFGEAGMALGQVAADARSAVELVAAALDRQPAVAQEAS